MTTYKDKKAIAESTVCPMITSESLIKAISLKNNIELSLIRKILIHNVLTVRQTSLILDQNIDYVNNQIRVGKLTACIPFPSSSFEPKPRVFILRDEKFDNYVNAHLKN